MKPKNPKTRYLLAFSRVYPYDPLKKIFWISLSIINYIIAVNRVNSKYLELLRGIITLQGASSALRKTFQISVLACNSHILSVKYTLEIYKQCTREFKL